MEQKSLTVRHCPPLYHHPEAARSGRRYRTVFCKGRAAWVFIRLDFVCLSVSVTDPQLAFHHLEVSDFGLSSVAKSTHLFARSSRTSQPQPVVFPSFAIHTRVAILIGFAVPD